MRDYDLYLFDFDNTLFDTFYGMDVILSRALPAANIRYEKGMFSQLVGLDLEQIFYRLEGDPALFDSYMSEAMAVVNSDTYLNAAPFPDTAETLKGLREMGKRVGIVSGKMHYKIDRLLSVYGLESYVEHIVGYDDTEYHKPNPEPLLKSLEHFGVSKDKVLFIGDSSNDSGCAHSCGVDCAIVRRPYFEDCHQVPYTYRIDSLTEVLGR